MLPVSSSNSSKKKIDMSDDSELDQDGGGNLNRRKFLSACSASSLMLADGSCAAADDGAAPPAGDAPTTAVDFSRSFLYCTPKGTDIWVRPQIECICQVFDRRTGAVDEYVLSVVAKTGLTRSSSGVLQPGYDYWIIFSKQYVYTRRTHTSSYFNNPTTLELDEFGMAKWRLQRVAATRLHSAADLRRALEAWEPLVARTEFSSGDRSRGFVIEYPVKWADFSLTEDKFRIETGPVVLLDMQRNRAGEPAKFEDFQWAHLDYRSFDQVRCLLDQPTPILTGASFTPPAEHQRDRRRHPALTSADVKQIETRCFDWPASPIPAKAMRELLQTDHYSAVADYRAATELYSLPASG